MNAPKKLLIIEDDPIIANIYRSRFEKEGYAVEVAADGQSGFYRIHELHPDVVLLDLMLPHINGVDILKKIRVQKKFEKLPVIVFTNAYFREMIQDALNAGATKVFHKATLTPRQLVEAIEEALYPGGAAPAVVEPATPAIQPQAVPATVAPVPVPAATAPPTPTAPAEAPAPGGEAAFKAELLKSFFASSPERLSSLRRHVQDFAKAADETGRVSVLGELYRKVHAITSGAGIVDLHSIAQVSACLEALLKELSEKPRSINASTTRTIGHAVDFLGTLLDPAAPKPSADAPPPSILVVDDEIISRKAVIFALEKASLKAVAVEDPNVALALSGTNQFDLVILDVDMPSINGFDLCKRLRALPEYKDTPVIFVTSLTDFESRAASMLSGGNDLIAKPFLFTELALKALLYVTKSRLKAAKP
jgi:DNA-binding response OmpR family regulator/HPt (histidine-containing phosphotransfer) domain-containing protein